MIFIAEVKNKSPFGFHSGLCIYELLNIAVEHGDWISVHTDYKWGGSFKWLKWCVGQADKPVIAKGIHSTDSQIEKAIDCGASYVLVVDRIPAEKYIERCMLEFHSFMDFLNCVDKYPEAKCVYNQRDLTTGKMKEWNSLREWKQARPETWMCQASGIVTPNDLIPQADAFIVGENLPTFVRSYNTPRRFLTKSLTTKEKPQYEHIDNPNTTQHGNLNTRQAHCFDA